MASKSSSSSTKSHSGKKKVVTDRHHGNNDNPLQKIFAGFCDPFIPPSSKDDEEKTQDSVDSSKYAADLTPLSPNKTRKSRGLTIDTTDSQTAGGGMSHGLNLHGDDDDDNHGGDERIPSTVTTPGTVLDEDTFEREVSKRVVTQRRKHGISVFLVAFCSVLATLLALKKLGYTTDLEKRMEDGSQFVTDSSKRFIEIVWNDNGNEESANSLSPLSSPSSPPSWSSMFQNVIKVKRKDDSDAKSPACDKEAITTTLKNENDASMSETEKTNSQDDADVEDDTVVTESLTDNDDDDDANANKESQEQPIDSAEL